MSNKTDDRTPHSQTPAAATDTAASPPQPRYEKPVLRRYDQIEQVRPYGPSEI